MRAVKLSLFLLSLTYMLAGCTNENSMGLPAVSLNEPLSQNSLNESEWLSIVADHERRGVIIDDFATILDARGILKTPKLLSALSLRKTGVLGLTREESAALTKSLSDSTAGCISFGLALETEDFKTNHLDESNAVWRLRLISEDANNYLAPKTIVRTGKPTEEELSLFIHWHSHDALYNVCFDSAAFFASPISKTKTLRLRISGIKGYTDLVWKLN